MNGASVGGIFHFTSRNKSFCWPGLGIGIAAQQGFAGVKVIAATAIEYAQGWRGHRDVKQKLSPPNLLIADS
jgi:hypothetical protein